jgi:hypothetical protein
LETRNGTTSISGTFHSNAGNSEMNLINADVVSIDVSFRAHEGQSLALLFDGAADQVTLANGRGLYGSGSFKNPVRLAHAGRVAPGDSVGRLTAEGDVSFDSGGLYWFEVQSAHGAAGVGYDTLVVGGTIDIAASPLNPFTIEVLGLDANGDPGVVVDFDPHTSYRWTIASAPLVTGFDPAAFRVDAAAFIGLHGPLPDGSFFDVALSNDQLQLIYVPEPASLALMGLGGLLIVHRRRRAASCRVKVQVQRRSRRRERRRGD